MCRSNGSIRTPAGNITTGYKNSGGYRIWQMQHPRKNLLVHRLICEAFHGPCPIGKEVDHIDRNRGNNRPENLRWVTRSENNRNTAVSEAAVRIYGFHPADNPLEYARMYEKLHAQDNSRKKRDRYAKDPEYREKELRRQRSRYANDPEFRARKSAYHRSRWRDDPEFRERQKMRNCAHKNIRNPDKEPLSARNR